MRMDALLYHAIYSRCQLYWNRCQWYSRLNWFRFSPARFFFSSSSQSWHYIEQCQCSMFLWGLYVCGQNRNYTVKCYTIVCYNAYTTLIIAHGISVIEQNSRYIYLKDISSSHLSRFLFFFFICLVTNWPLLYEHL